MADVFGHTGLDPEMAPVPLGVPFTVMDCIDLLPLPQALEPEMEILAVEADAENVTPITEVPCPELMVNPDGTDQLKEERLVIPVTV